MKKLLFFLAALLPASQLLSQDHIITSSGFAFDPANLTINAGESVQWQNVSGLHNANGSLATFPSNPEGFSSGSPSSSAWTFTHTFTIPGAYQYRCDVHFNMGMTGTIVVNPVSGGDNLVLTAVFDGPLPSGLPKGIEMYVLNDIPDMSIYGVGSANNGTGSAGVEYTFPAVPATAGDYIYLTSDSLAFVQFFGFSPDFTDPDGSVNINGDDAIELFENGNVVDVFGDINVDGTGQPWEYLDGWAYRINGTGPDGSTFVLSNWLFSGIDGLEGGMTNATCAEPVPVGTYQPTGSTEPIANDDDVTTDVNQQLVINVLANDFIPSGQFTVTQISSPTNGTLSLEPDFTFIYSPNPDFCGTDGFTYEVCDIVNNTCDQATVSIEVICPSSYPAYNIGDVDNIDAAGQPDSLGVTCQLQGIVHGVDLQGNDNIQFTLIDPTGGITVFSTNNFGYTVTEGDEVVVRGAITQFNCLTQVTPDTLWIESTGNALVTPLVLTAAMTEDHESELIRINGLTLVDPGQWNPAGAGFNVDVTDGTTTWAMRIDADVDLFNTPAPGSSFDAIGLGGQFDNDGTCDGEGYQFLPRYIPDIMFVGNTNEPAEAALVSFFPNPVSGVLNIRSEVALDQVELFDLLGRQVAVWNQPSSQVSLNGVESGMYILRFRTGQAVWSRELVVK